MSTDDTRVHEAAAGSSNTSTRPPLRGLSVQTSSSTSSVAPPLDVVPPTPILVGQATGGWMEEHSTRPKLRHKLSDSFFSSFRDVKSALPSLPRRKSSEGSSSSTRTALKAEHGAKSTSSLGALPSLHLRAPGVKLTLLNQTGLPLSLSTWPIRSEDGETCEMRAFRGSGVVEQSLPDQEKVWKGDEASVLELGTVRRPMRQSWSAAHGHEEGWVFFDVLLPPPPNSPFTRPHALHLQAYLRLSTSGSARSSLGRFDLDSSTDKPMPSGHLGRVEVVRSGIAPSSQALPRPSLGHQRSSSLRTSVDLVEVKEKDQATELGDVVEVRFFLTPDVAQAWNEVDDGTKGGSWMKPSKGIVVSSWVSHEDVVVSLIIKQAGKEARYHEHTSYRHNAHSTSPSHARTSSFVSTASTTRAIQHSPTPHGLRTSHHVLDGFDYRTCWIHVRHGKDIVLERMLKINPLDGSVTGAQITSTVDTPAFFDHEHALSVNYGFFDSGVGRSKQLYIYASKRQTSWLGDLVKANPLVLEAPFEALVLAGSHDAGMFGRINSDLLRFIKKGQAGDVPTVARALPLLRFVLGLLKTFSILENLANTQKDTIVSQLQLGVRFFDFRPGYCLFDIVDEIKGELRHHHSIVPGCSYEGFLIDIFTFLHAHPQEIVVVELKSDGFPFTSDVYDPETGKLVAISMIPSTEELAAVLLSASLVDQSILVGDAGDLSLPIGSLLQQNKRLILIDRVHALPPYPQADEGAPSNPKGVDAIPERERWERADSYSHEMYDGDDAEKIKAALMSTHEDACYRSAAGEGGATIYQLQATPTASVWADVGASLTYSDASSLLVWSKARMDRVTYPWLAATTFIEPGNVIFLNDFVDGALVEHTLDKTRERLDLWLAKHPSSPSQVGSGLRT